MEFYIKSQRVKYLICQLLSPLIVKSLDVLNISERVFTDFEVRLSF